ncbi:hypothetical protein ACQGRP_24130 [Klebsiella pneumoniae]
MGPDPRNFNQRVSLGRNDLLIRTFLKEINEKIFSLLKNKLDGFNVLTHLMDQDEITIYILDGKLLINNFKSTPN